MMENRRPSRDLLSDLPVNLIENIMVCLPIRDAIRTSVLSTKWRFRWTTLPNLVFDMDAMTFLKEKIDWEDDYDEFFTTFVTRTLSRHQGPLHKFMLVSYLDMCSEADKWMLFLLRKDIKVLILRTVQGCDSVKFNVPACLFSFENLTFLEFVGYDLYIPPLSNFKGFLCLRTLILESVKLPAATIECFVAQSPLLENLECVYSVKSRSKLVISAPKLKYLCLGFSDYDGINVSLLTPLLAKMKLSVCGIASFGTKYVEKHVCCYYTTFFGGLANLETLIGEGCMTKYLILGIKHYQRPLVFHRLKTIALGEVSFESMDEMLAVVRLIVDASATLCELQLSVYMEHEEEDDSPTISGECYWDSICPQNCTFGKLKFVEFDDFYGEIHELNFIKFLLESSSVLEKMTIKGDATKKCIIEMLSYCRASANATIVYEQTRDQACPPRVFPGASVSP